MPDNSSEWWALGGFLLAVILTASSGAIFRPGAWLESLKKPSWQPPNWLFGPVWSVLYLMIGYAGWRVWREIGFDPALPLALFAGQLVLNFAWSGIFFGMKRMGLALFEVGLLWLSIAGLIVLFHPVDELAAWLLVPYLAWVSFAAVLNGTLWRLNPDARPA